MGKFGSRIRDSRTVEWRFWFGWINFSAKTISNGSPFSRMGISVTRFQCPDIYFINIFEEGEKGEKLVYRTSGIDES